VGALALDQPGGARFIRMRLRCRVGLHVMIPLAVRARLCGRWLVGGAYE
jgi:hypothetical protein